jgi:hypothetical protein
LINSLAVADGQIVRGAFAHDGRRKNTEKQAEHSRSGAAHHHQFANAPVLALVRRGDRLLVDDDTDFAPLRRICGRTPKRARTLCGLPSNETGRRRNTSERRWRRRKASFFDGRWLRRGRVPAKSLAYIADFLGFMEFV